jgi:hypothetical protein
MSYLDSRPPLYKLFPEELRKTLGGDPSATIHNFSSRLNTIWHSPHLAPVGTQPEEMADLCLKTEGKQTLRAAFLNYHLDLLSAGLGLEPMKHFLRPILPRQTKDLLLSEGRLENSLDPIEELETEENSEVDFLPLPLALACANIWKGVPIHPYPRKVQMYKGVSVALTMPSDPYLLDLLISVSTMTRVSNAASPTVSSCSSQGLSEQRLAKLRSRLQRPNLSVTIHSVTNSQIQISLGFYVKVGSSVYLGKTSSSYLHSHLPQVNFPTWWEYKFQVQDLLSRTSSSISDIFLELLSIDQTIKTSSLRKILHQYVTLLSLALPDRSPRRSHSLRMSLLRHQRLLTLETELSKDKSEDGKQWTPSDSDVNLLLNLSGIQTMTDMSKS